LSRLVPGGARLEKILVAWKDTREARRAVYDSLPILRRAKAVRVLEIVEGEESPKRAEGRVRDIVAWLKAHEVAASKLVMTPLRDTSEAIATVAEDFDADWIVAGAYGHTRVGERIFGGVTRHLLMESRRPALLSH
jgi:nucleotide-binding universal stress UspA family protein